MCAVFSFCIAVLGVKCEGLECARQLSTTEFKPQSCNGFESPCKGRVIKAINNSWNDTSSIYLALCIWWYEARSKNVSTILARWLSGWRHSPPSLVTRILFPGSTWRKETTSSWPPHAQSDTWTHAGAPHPRVKKQNFKTKNRMFWTGEIDEWLRSHSPA